MKSNGQKVNVHHLNICHFSSTNELSSFSGTISGLIRIPRRNSPSPIVILWNLSWNWMIGQFTVKLTVKRDKITGKIWSCPVDFTNKINPLIDLFYHVWVSVISSDLHWSAEQFAKNRGSASKSIDGGSSDH